MPNQSMTQCQARLKADLDEVNASINFSNAAFKVYASSGQILRWVGAEHDLRTIMLDFRSSTLSDLGFIFQSLYIQSWSAFELFVRTLVISYVDEVADRTSDFNSLDQAKLIDRNMYHTGVALQQIFENRSNLSIDYYRVAQNIGTAHPDSRKVLLNSFSFGMFLKAPTAVGIEEALKRIGFKQFDWDRIGEIPAIQAVFQTRNPRETSKQIIEFLASSEKTRNNIVHRGEGIRPVSESDLRYGISAFAAIGDALVEFLRNALPG
jgi:hypothetical protein